VIDFGPSSLVAFVRPELDLGPILSADGEFLEEVREAGSWDIGDHNMPLPTEMGLQVFEGWREVSPGPDPDISFVGSWRRLTHWEICRMRFGLTAHPADREQALRGAEGEAK
jgi:hypothetical protein